MGKAPRSAPGKADAFCGSCGTALRDGARFCPVCGGATNQAPLPGAPPPTAPPPTTSTRRVPILAVALVALAGLAGVIVWQLSGDDPSDANDPTSASPSGESSSLLALQPEDAADAVDCSSPCEVTGVVAFLHPSWGASNLVTVNDVPGEYAARVVDEDGEVVWTAEFGPSWYELAPNDPAVDETGHVFLNFNPGRYNGVIVLEPVEDGFEDFDTLPPDGDYSTRFYYAETVDVEGDGTFEVEVSANDCDPSCADGAITSTVYTWDGEDYR